MPKHKSSTNLEDFIPDDTSLSDHENIFMDMIFGEKKTESIHNTDKSSSSKSDNSNSSSYNTDKSSSSKSDNSKSSSYNTDKSSSSKSDKPKSSNNNTDKSSSSKSDKPKSSSNNTDKSSKSKCNDSESEPDSDKSKNNNKSGSFFDGSLNTIIFVIIVTIIFLILSCPTVSIWLTTYIPDPITRWIALGFIFFIIVFLFDLVLSYTGKKRKHGIHD